jgi:hypothetical protein
MVDKALVLENHRGVMERKRKLVHQHQPGSVKLFSAPTISRLLLLKVTVFRRPKLPKTHSKMIVGATIVVKRDISSTEAPIHALVLISLLQPHLSLPVEPTLLLLLPSRTTPMGESIMWPWKKRKKLLILSLVCFSSMTLLQLCCLILEYRILSHLLHMLGSIIYPYLC